MTPVTGEYDQSSAVAVDRRFMVAMAVVLVGALALRVAHIWFDRRFWEYTADAWYYHQAANLLADGQGFIHPYGWLEGKAVQAADHPPLYILYLAGWSLLGVTSVTGHLLVSALLGVVSVLFAGLVGRRIGGPRVGIVAAVLMAVYPNVWRYDGLLMSETLVITMVMLTICLAYRFLDRPTPARLVAVAACVALATLARSELLLLAPFLVVPLVLWVPGRSWRWRLGWVAGAAVTVVMVLSPWLVLNHQRFEEPVLLSQNLGGTLAVSYCETTYDGPLLGYWDYNCGPKALAAAGVSELGDPRIDPVMRDAGLEFLGDNLSRLPAVVLAREGRILGVFRPEQQRNLDQLFEFMTPEVATAGMVTLPIMIVGAVAGSVVLRRRRQVQFPLLAPIVTVVVTVAAFYAATRFRATAEGPLVVLAAVAVGAALDRIRRPRRADDAPGGSEGPDHRPAGAKVSARS